MSNLVEFVITELYKNNCAISVNETVFVPAPTAVFVPPLLSSEAIVKRLSYPS